MLTYTTQGIVINLNDHFIIVFYNYYFSFFYLTLLFLMFNKSLNLKNLELCI